jgi:hypothetical protein
MHFFAHLADRHLLHSTMKVYLSAITFHSQLSGFPLTARTMPRLHYLLMGIRRSQGGTLSKPRRAPLSTHHLISLREFLAIQYPPHDSRMLWAAFTAAFFGLLRSSEYTCPTESTVVPSSLLCAHVAIAPDFAEATLLLPFSKTDRFGSGVHIHLFSLPSPFCPLSALVHFLSVRSRAAGPLFIFMNGAFPRQPTLNTHSFRIGGASALADAGVPDYIIQLMGRWSSDSFLRYIHVPTTSLRAFHHSMLGHVS